MEVRWLQSMPLAPLNCPKIPLCITHLVVFRSPSAVPSNLEKSGKCPSSSLNSCHAPECWGQKIRTCFAVSCPLLQLQRGEDTEGTLAWERKNHPGHLFPFWAGKPASSLPSWAPHEASRHRSLGGPQLSLGWEGFLLKTATATTKGCWFCNLPLLK